MDNYIGILATIQDISQRSPETIGTAMNTIMSRFGNIKAGKFVATQEDMASADYDEDSFSNLNDIETVLDTVGIKLRESYGVYRDIQDVLQDIADIWDTISQTEQNALASAIAGTRQRELVLTLFENWDSVQNFAQIADNAYGTAEQKMEAFTDSVEAAQNRLSTAVEQWALFFDGAEVMKSFYNVVSDVIENLDLFITVVGGFTVLANIQKILPVLAGGLSSFTNKIVSFGNILSNVRGPAGQEKGEGFSKTFWSSMDSEFIYQQQQYYGKRLQSLTKVLGEQEQQGLLSVQNALINNKSQEKATLADILLTTNKEQLAQKLLLGIREENRSAIVNGMLSTLRTEELTALRQKVRQDLEAAWQTDQVTQEQVDLEIATRLLTDRYKEEAGQISRNLKASSKNSVGKSLLSSLGTLAAGAGSAYGYGAIGEYLGGDRGKTIGSLLGGTAGSAIIGSFVNNVVTNGLKGALTGMSGGAKFGVAGAIAGAVGGIALGVWQANEQKKLEEAAEKFQEINEELKTMQSSLADASKFDDLVNGVDKFGNNVSLTDEEYQEFLDISNSLAQVFPSLVVGVDEFGNRLVGTEGEVNAVSDAIDGLLERQQHLANQALLNDDLLEESFKTAKKQYQNAQEDAEYAEKAYERLGFAQIGDNNLISLNNNRRSEELAKRLKAAGIDADYYEDNYGGSVFYDIDEENAEEQLAIIEQVRNDYLNEINESKNEMSEATASLSDQINAIWNEMEYGYYGDMYKNMIQGMDENIATMIQESLSAISLNTDSNDLEQVIKDTVSKLNSAFETNSGIIDLYYQWKEADTQGDARDARNQLKKELASAFGDSYDETEEKILLSLGFRVETDSEGNQYLIDEYDYYMRTLDELNRAYLPNITSAEFNSLSESEAKEAFELFKSGAISASIAYEDLLNLVRNETPDTLTGMVQALKDQLTLIDSDEFASDIKSFFANSTVGNIDDITQHVNENFSYLPEHIRNLLIQLAQDIQNSGGEGMTEAFGEVMDSMVDEAQNMADTVRQEAWTSLFPDLEGEIEGQVDSFSELYKVMNSVAESYEMLKNAQEEQKETGRVSGETFMSMLNENPEYIKAFDIDEETGRISLASDALEQFNQIRLASIKTAITEMQTDEFATIQKLKYEKAILEGDEATARAIANSLNDIEVTKARTAAYIQLGNALQYVNSSMAGEDAETAKQALVDNWSEYIDNITLPEIDPDSMTEEEKEKRIGELNDLIESHQETYDKLEELYETFGGDTELFSDTDFWNWWHNSAEDANGDIEDALQKRLEILQKYRSLIDKEWEAMQVFDEDTFTYGRTAYFDKMRTAMEEEVKLIKQILDESDLTIEERLDYEADLIELQRDLNNLDDEEVEDRISLLETQEASVGALIAAQKELIETTDTEEELIERQKELNDLLWEERDLRREIREYERDILDYALEYQSGTAYSDSATYDRLTNMKLDSLRDDAEQLLNDIEIAKQEAYQQYINEGMYSEAEAWAMAEKSERVRDLTLEYMETVNEQGEVMVDSVNAKIDEISQMITDLENMRPDEWTSIGQIRNYAAETIGLLEQKLPILQAALEDTSMMTDEQVRDLVNQINEVTQALYDAQVQMHQDIQEYQENVYDAIVNTVTRYKEEIEEARDDLMDSYDDEIDKLNDINDERQDAIDLEEALQNLENQKKEKERVYREGETLPSIKITVSVKGQRWLRLRK